MGTNVHQFNKEVNGVVKDFTTKKALDFQRLVAMELFRRIILRTPVDTGRARGNWQITINAPPTEILEREGKQFESVINAELGKLNSIPMYSTVYITNNLDYIYYLEYDRRSPKSPDGMVEISLKEVADELRERR